MYVECIARLISTTVRLEPEDVRAKVSVWSPRATIRDGGRRRHCCSNPRARSSATNPNSSAIPKFDRAGDCQYGRAPACACQDTGRSGRFSGIPGGSDFRGSSIRLSSAAGFMSCRRDRRRPNHIFDRDQPHSVTATGRTTAPSAARPIAATGRAGTGRDAATSAATSAIAT